MADDKIPLVTLVTLGVALYGGLLSTANVLWTIVRDVRDKGRLRIGLMVGRMMAASGAAIRMVMTPQGPKPVNLSARDRVFITITNVGRRPITVQQCTGVQGPLRWVSWFRLRRQPFVLVPGELPLALKPGESVTEWIFDQPKDIEPVRALYVWDSTGARWRVPRRLLRRTKERALMPDKSVAGPQT